MSTQRVRLSWLLTLLASACAAAHDEPTLNDYADQMAESLEAIQASSPAHHRQILAQTDLQRVRELENAYLDDIAMRVGRMRDAQDSMQLCAHMAMSEPTESLQLFHRARSAMASSLELASNETDRHWQAMQSAGNLRAVVAEEHRNLADMEPLLERMRTDGEELGRAMGAIQDEGFSMMCPMASRIHR